MEKINYLEISYPNFTLGSIIDPEQANQNNHEFITKINDIIEVTHDVVDEVGRVDITKADKIYVDTKDLEIKNSIDNLAGVGRNTETVKQNATNLITHKTSTDHDARYYTKTEVNSLNTVINQSISVNGNNLITHKASTDHDIRYYTKEELIPFLRGGDTLKREEVFTIISSNNGDGTFTYMTDSVVIAGMLSVEGYQIFELNKGIYNVGENRLDVYIDDTLRRSATSGGIIELDQYSFALIEPQGSGREITAVYLERLGMSAEYNIKMSNVKPPLNSGRTMWFKVIG